VWDFTLMFGMTIGPAAALEMWAVYSCPLDEELKSKIYSCKRQWEQVSLRNDLDCFQEYLKRGSMTI